MIQNRFIRFLNNKITKVYVNDKIGVPRFKYGFKLLEIKILNIDFFFRILCGYFDSLKLTTMVLYHVPPRNTRSKDLLANPSYGTKLGINSPLIRLSIAFNKYCENMDVFTMSAQHKFERCSKYLIKIG